MKKFLFVITALSLIFTAVPESYSGVKQNDKKAKKTMKKKAYKQARKEAKKYRKDGWYVAPGALPMDKQIEKAWLQQYEEDENGYPLYLVANGNSVAQTQSAAKIQATELAKFELAGMVETNIVALVENSVANNQLTREEAASVTKTVAASKNIISQKIGRVITLFEIYREMGDNNIESSVRIGYNTKLANEVAINTIKEELEDEAEELHDKLDKILDL